MTEDTSKVKKRRSYIGQRVDEQCIEYLEEKFGCKYACFTKRPDGTYDPLDAMRRDAYREVVGWLKKERELYKKENND